MNLGLLDQELHGYHTCLGFLENKDYPFDALNKDPDYRVVSNQVLMEPEAPENLTEYAYGNHLGRHRDRFLVTLRYRSKFGTL